MSDRCIAAIREVLEYNPLTGFFFWKVPTTNAVEVGSVAGGLTEDGYVVIRVFKRLYRAHRLAFAFIHGRWPSGDVDHRDLIRTNNAASNLRECSKSENQCNRTRQSNGASGFKGVTYDKQTGKFKAQIGLGGKNYHLGRFKTKVEAASVYNLAAAKLHGEFARVNQ